MVPLRAPFVTSKYRFAITTRGINKSDINKIVELIDIVINNAGNEKVILSVKKRVNHLMKDNVRSLVYVITCWYASNLAFRCEAFKSFGTL